MDVTKARDPVGKAVADIRKATDRLIKLLVNQDETVGERAAAALAAIDPPPVWALTDVLIQGRDKSLRLRVVAVLARIAETEPIRVLAALGSAFRVIKDLEVRRAVIDAMLGMKMIFEQAGQVSSHGGDPGNDTTPPEVEGRGGGPEDDLPAWRRPRPRSDSRG